MNIAGIGIDTIEIERFARTVEARGERFLERIFTPSEMDRSVKASDRNAHLAGKFTAKEAVKKSMPDGARIGLAWPEIEILNDEDGKPYVVLHGRAKEIFDDNGLAGILVSIAHSDTAAVANAISIKHGE